MSQFSLENQWASYAQALLRIVSGFMLSLHGLTLLFGFFNSPDHPAQRSVVFTLIWFAGVLQLGGGTLLILGLFTRPVSFILSGHMAFAYFTAHAPKSFWPILNGGELAALYSFVFLFLVFGGPGAFSLDGRIADSPGKRRYFDQMS